MSTQRLDIDVSGLSSHVITARSLLWWGNVGMLVIETTMFAMAIGCYFFLRTNALVWPPPTVNDPGLGLSGIILAILLLSLVPAIIGYRAALREERGTVTLCLVLVSLAGLAVLALRFWGFQGMDFRWDSHAYGSIVWVLLGLHTFHVTIATADTLVLGSLYVIGPLEKKHFLDARIDALYWYFVVGWWIPLYAVIYLFPYISR